jgi:hypothetical protein
MCAASRKISLTVWLFETGQGQSTHRGMGWIISAFTAEFSDAKVQNVVTQTA